MIEESHQIWTHRVNLIAWLSHVFAQYVGSYDWFWQANKLKHKNKIIAFISRFQTFKSRLQVKFIFSLRIIETSDKRV